jgi:hypothetical protein
LALKFKFLMYLWLQTEDLKLDLKFDSSLLNNPFDLNTRLDTGVNFNRM